jgi:hypothetical protein
MSQWRVFSRTIVVTSDPTSFAYAPSAAPFAFSPPIDSTGMFNLVRDSSSNSLAVCGNETK